MPGRAGGGKHQAYRNTAPKASSIANTQLEMATKATRPPPAAEALVRVGRVCGLHRGPDRRDAGGPGLHRWRPGRPRGLARVGGPPGDYTDLGFTHPIPPDGTEFWPANDGLLTVMYGGDRRVAQAAAEPYTFSSRGFFWHRLRARLGL
jgi:hypothetical protein